MNPAYFVRLERDGDIWLVSYPTRQAAFTAVIRHQTAEPDGDSPIRASYAGCNISTEEHGTLPGQSVRFGTLRESNRN